MPETLDKTNLAFINMGDLVNLERAMPVNGRFNGHFVSGHIDGIGRIVELRKLQNSTIISIECDNSLLRYIVSKGSVAIDGISLTVVTTSHNSFSVSIIPHSLDNTNIKTYRIGSVVNIECDILGKYIEKFLFNNIDNSNNLTDTQSRITQQFLEKHGFF